MEGLPISLIEVPRGRRFYLAAQWIILAANNRSGRPMAEKLALELIAANGDGGAIKKKDDTHRMAEANKAFSFLDFNINCNGLDNFELAK